MLVDTPVGPYFSQFSGERRADRFSVEVRHVLEEVELEIVKHCSWNPYLEDFAAFCQSIGGDTAEVMGEILNARATKAHQRHSRILRDAVKRTADAVQRT